MQAPVNRLVRRRPQASAGRHAERGAPTAVDLVLEVEDGAVPGGSGGYDDRAGAVAKQDARRTVGVVENARHHVGADDERVIVGAGRHQLARRRQGVGEGRARGAQVEAPRVTRADLVLDEAGRARKHHIRRHGADHDDADIVRRQTGSRNRHDRRFFAEVGRGGTGIGDVSLADPDPLHDPFVARVDHLLEI